LKNASPSKQEQARLEVENAEDDLVQKTEVAITLMKTVLENVSYAFFVHKEKDSTRFFPIARTDQEPQ
jgi:putative heme iron utilization protein